MTQNNNLHPEQVEAQPNSSPTPWFMKPLWFWAGTVIVYLIFVSVFTTLGMLLSLAGLIGSLAFLIHAKARERIARLLKFDPAHPKGKSIAAGVFALALVGLFISVGGGTSDLDPAAYEEGYNYGTFFQQSSSSEVEAALQQVKKSDPQMWENKGFQLGFADGAKGRKRKMQASQMNYDSPQTSGR